MAESLYQTEPTFRRSLEQCNEILRPHLDRTLLDLLYPADGRPSPLDQTIYTQPVTVALNKFIGQYGTQWEKLMAVSTTIALPIIAIFAALQRYIISGLVAGSVKE